MYKTIKNYKSDLTANQAKINKFKFTVAGEAASKSMGSKMRLVVTAS